MVVVQTTNGLALAPKDQYDAYQAQQRVSQQAPAPAGTRQRGILGQPQRPPHQPGDGIPVPNMAEGLPKPRPWGEPVQPPMPGDAQPVQQQAPQQQQAPRRTSKAQGGNMDQTKIMIANEVAKLVHASVEDADEPEEFVQKVLSKGYPAMIVQTIAAMSAEEVIAGIVHVQPNSAGATPAGQRFVREAMAALRAAVTGGAG
jgi:hypothetical protein